MLSSFWNSAAVRVRVDRSVRGSQMRHSFFNCSLLVVVGLYACSAFAPAHFHLHRSRSRQSLASKSQDEQPARSTEEAEEAVAEDWRDFRARLIARENAGSEDAAVASANDGLGWTYETPLAETGVVILGGTEGFGFGLSQQYFHKSVILVLQHDEKFTRGVILNRPTGVKLATDDSDEEFDVWFGGDVCGLLGPEQTRDITCLHALPTEDNPMVDRLSFPVIRGISYTTLDGAQELVRLGVAEASDFWVFVVRLRLHPTPETDPS